MCHPAHLGEHPIDVRSVPLKQFDTLLIINSSTRTRFCRALSTAYYKYDCYMYRALEYSLRTRSIHPSSTITCTLLTHIIEISKENNSDISL